VEIARSNAVKADVEDTVRFEVANALQFRGEGTYGRLVTNPPYGERLLEKQEAGALYRAFGSVVRQLPPDWRVSILSSHTEFEDCLGIKAVKKRKLYNGMLKCDLFMYGKV
jgi:putative N6-adenine-specific DNA methylase